MTAFIYLASKSPRRQELLREQDMPTAVQSDMERPPAAGVTLLQGILGEGFVVKGVPAAPTNGNGANGASAESNVHLYTDAELFGWSRPQARSRPQHHSRVAPELFFADVKMGDFVVHIEHGIGQFDGLVRIQVGGVDREYLQVNYARGDKLYVPVHQADRLSRYVGAGERVPPISRLGTADWALTK